MSIVTDGWNRIKITSAEKLQELWNDSGRVQDFAIDTETDGLFQMTAKPFVIVFGWISEGLNQKNITTVFEPTPELMQKMYDLCMTAPRGYMHNAKFDLHMLENLYKRYPGENIYDTTIIARLVLEAKGADNGGPSLALKDLATAFIERSGKEEQTEIKAIKKRIAKLRADQLNAAIASLGYDTRKEWNKTKLEAINSDPLLKISEEVPEDIQYLWKKWTTKYPATKGLKKTERVTYKDIYESSPEAKEAMLSYAFKDVIYTLLLAKKFMPFIEKIGSTEILESERKALFAFYRSERVGINIDMNYIEEAKSRLRGELLKTKEKLQELLGAEYDARTFTNSSKQIGEYLVKNNVNVLLSPKKNPKADSASRDYYISQPDTPAHVKEVLEQVKYYKDLNKKYTTDLLGYERNIWNGRRYTSYNMAKAVTGRITNDMQQMANEAIYDQEGNELFHPRRTVIPSGPEYPKLLYIDYSQVELRLQAHYTWIAMEGKGDINLLRMYVPFKCYTKVWTTYWDDLDECEVTNSERLEWDPTNPEHTKQSFIEEYEWIQLEDNKPWEITDMHMLTARQAFPELKGLPNDDKLVKKRRKQAKSVNFAIQYGAGANKIKTMTETPDIGEALYAANKKAFKGLVAYANMLESNFNKNGFVENAYGRKYRTKWFSHKFANYVIQGSGAEILKRKLVECDKYLEDKKTRIIHNIHDEIQFEVHKDEDYVIHKLQDIMADTGDKFIVPILADLEISTTNWKEKYEIK